MQGRDSSNQPFIPAEANVTSSYEITDVHVCAANVATTKNSAYFVPSTTLNPLISSILDL
jgi:hypothetical protein